MEGAAVGRVLLLHPRRLDREAGHEGVALGRRLGLGLVAVDVVDVVDVVLVERGESGVVEEGAAGVSTAGVENGGGGGGEGLVVARDEGAGVIVVVKVVRRLWLLLLLLLSINEPEPAREEEESEGEEQTALLSDEARRPSHHLGDRNVRRAAASIHGTGRISYDGQAGGMRSTVCRGEDRGAIR